MADNKDNLYSYFCDMAKGFDGDKALFWAGRMSMVIDMMNHASINQLSRLMELLLNCKRRYDGIITKRTEEN